MFPVRYELDFHIRVFLEGTQSLNAGLLAMRRFVFGKSDGRLTPSRFSDVFLGLIAKVESVLKFHVALYASHVALPMVT
jgi:hypothetical protein